MIVVTLLNEKGGVGKSTMAINLAAWLASQGKKVVFIDLDPQGTASVMMGWNNPVKDNVFSLFVQRDGWDEVLVPAFLQNNNGHYQPLAFERDGQLQLLRGSQLTRNIPNEIGSVFVIDERLLELEDMGIDYVFIDTSPTPSALHAFAYAASDHVILPTECEFGSIDGLSKSLANVKNYNERFARPIHIAGIIPTKVDTRTLEHRENLVDIQQTYGSLVMAPMRHSIIWAESSRARLPMFIYIERALSAMSTSKRNSEEGKRLEARLNEFYELGDQLLEVVNV